MMAKLSLHDSNPKSALLEWIDIDQLEEEYGGTLKNKELPYWPPVLDFD